MEGGRRADEMAGLDDHHRVDHVDVERPCEHLGLKIALSGRGVREGCVHGAGLSLGLCLGLGSECPLWPEAAYGCRQSRRYADGVCPARYPGATSERCATWSSSAPAATSRSPTAPG